MRPDLATELEFVTNRLFFDLKVAAKSLKLGLDSHTEKRIDRVKAGPRGREARGDRGYVMTLNEIVDLSTNNEWLNFVEIDL